MAHMVETMAYAGEVPWHGLGKQVLPDLTPEQMLEAAGLNWEVEKRDVTYQGRDGSRRRASNKKALVRVSDDSFLDMVTAEWNPLQNIEAFNFFNDFVMAGDMEMHTAGSLENGRIVWALAKTKNSFELFGSDQVDEYLLFTNPHKFGKSIQVQSTPIRVVCKNTMTYALSTSSYTGPVRINHRQEFDADYVKEILGVSKEKLDTYKEVAEFLGSKRYTKDTLNNYFAEIFPRNGTPKKIEAPEDAFSRNHVQALDVIEQQPGHQYAEGSFWQAFNAVTYMTDHVMGRSADTRLTSAWFGANRKNKISALEKAVEYAEAA
jgi:phage/plasmid-like protein (TIGR03299 family)